MRTLYFVGVCWGDWGLIEVWVVGFIRFRGWRWVIIIGCYKDYIGEADSILFTNLNLKPNHHLLSLQAQFSQVKESPSSTNST